MRPAVAFLITWSCFGTRLHGDQRGSVDRFHNAPDTPRLPVQPRREAWERARCRNPAVRLTAAERGLVAAAIRKHCELRRWLLRAENVRTTHVHIVIENPGIAPEEIMRQLKAWSTRSLRAAGTRADGAPVWSAHGSTRYIWEMSSINAAIAYVRDGQDVPR